MEFYNDMFVRFPFLNQLDEPIGFCHSDNSGEFKREFKDKLDELNIGISNTISKQLCERSSRSSLNT
jgi:hypothetical protein